MDWGGLASLFGLGVKVVHRLPGRVRVHGETWSARTVVPLAQGQPVRIRSIDGLTLEVEPAEPGQAKEEN